MPTALRDPVGALPLASVAAGARRVAVIVDDLSHPTPAAAVLSLLIDDLEGVGIKREGVTIVVATVRTGQPPSSR